MKLKRLKIILLEMFKASSLRKYKIYSPFRMFLRQKIQRGVNPGRIDIIKRYLQKIEGRVNSTP